ncbi:hypothetical protein Fmac_020962 [Flemingia macrophylla]|uniref:Uncharacterized protein n=1 Tax=Flemingia macrophylla TaxID=520843 RepID=A0ABD1LVJ3_9FABA
MHLGEVSFMLLDKLVAAGIGNRLSHEKEFILHIEEAEDLRFLSDIDDLSTTFWNLKKAVSEPKSANSSVNKGQEKLNNVVSEPKTATFIGAQRSRENMSSSAANNDLGEHSSPPPKRGIKGTTKAKRARYIIKIPLQKNNSNEAPLEEPRPPEAQNADPVPSQPIVGEPNHPLPRDFEPHQCQPQIEQPTIGNEFVEQSPLHSNAFVVPTTSSSYLPPSVASQIVGGRRISLSSPSQANGSPASLPSQDNQNVVNVEGTTEGGDTSTYNDDDPPHGAVLEMIQPCNDGFFPSRVASKAITKTIKQHYVQPWPTWGAMSDEEKNNKLCIEQQEEFQSIYTQARSEAASCGGGSQSSPIDSVQEERIRKESWFTAAEPGHGIPDSAKILQLEEEVRQSREEARKSREEAHQTREANE